MEIAKIPVRRSARMLLTAICALMLVAGVLLLARLQVRAQAGPEAVEAELSVEKRANTNIAAPGDTLTYSVSIDSDLPETRLWMTDTLPPGLRLITESLDFSGKGSFGWTGNTVTWTSSSFGLGNFAVITFSAGISPDVEGEIVNTAQVTGTSELVTDTWSTNVVSGLLHSQIRSPNMDAYITKKGSLTISGIAWPEGIEPPYLTDDVRLEVERTGESAYLLRWTPVASNAYYLLEEATDRGFDSASSVYYDVGTEHPVVNEDGTYYYRVKADVIDKDPTRWSNVVSVTVPWLEAAVGGSASSLGAQGAADSLATVQVRTGEVGDIEASEWQTVDVTATEWGGWDWSYVWPLPERESTQYLIQSRASGDGESFGPIDTITVTLDNQIYLMYFPHVFKRWPPVPYGPSLNQIANPSNWVDYRVSWSYDDGTPDVPDPTTYTLQEAKDQDFTDPITYDPGSAEYYDVTDPAKQKKDGTYYYRVRGHNAYGAGEWSNISSTTVRVLPYAPTLNDIENEDQDGDYTVSWSYGYSYPPVTSYTLREARDEDFTTGVQDYTVDSDTFKEFDDKEDGTYYYKVQANNDYGPSAWSGTDSVDVVTTYRDDFDDSRSGWKVRRTSSPDLDKMDVRYSGGKLYTKADDRYDFGIFSPLVEAPAPPYRITMRTKLVEGVDAPGYGIVFRAEKGDFCPVDRDDAEDEDGCYYHYFRLNVSIDNVGKHIRYEVKRINDHDERGRAEGKDLSGGYHNIDGEAEWDGWNKWEIEVYEERFKVSVNGEHLATYYDDDYAEDGYFGILTSVYEYGPSEFKHDYFYVEPID
ncbi:MAG: hypothetical protein PVI07_03630 [Anaerolineae bacterium]